MNQINKDQGIWGISTQGSSHESSYWSLAEMLGEWEEWAAWIQFP